MDTKKKRKVYKMTLHGHLRKKKQRLVYHEPEEICIKSKDAFRTKKDSALGSSKKEKFIR